MQKNEGSKVVKWILIAVSVLFAFVFLILVIAWFPSMNTGYLSSSSR